MAAIALAIYGISAGNEAVLILAALAMAIGSNRVFKKPGNPTDPHTQSWGGGIGATLWLPLLLATVLAAALAILRIRQADPDLLGFGLWAGSIVLAVITGLAYDHGTVFWQRAREEIRWQGWDWVIALGLTIVALALRVYLLDQHLPAMHGDEGEMGELARLALYGPGGTRGPAPLHFFRTAFLDHPNLFHHLQAVGLRLFGDSEWGLKMISAVFGALCAPLIYAVGRIGWGRVAGLTAGWLLAVSHLHIHYSRVALNNIQSVWFAALFLLLLLIVDAAGRIGARTDTPSGRSHPPAGKRPVSLRDSRLTIYILIGLTTGLSQYFYYGSRLIAVMAVVFLLMLWRTKRAAPIYIVAAASSAILAFLPMIIFYTNNFITFTNRMRGVSILNPQSLQHILGPDARWPMDLPALLWIQVEQNLAFFVRGGDVSSFYTPSNPGFDVVTVGLFWLGVGLLISQWRRFPNQLIALWLMLGVFLGGVVTDNAPNGPRLIMPLLAVYVIASGTIQWLFGAIQARWPVVQRRVLPALTAILCGIVLYLNYNFYFVQFAHINPLLPTTEIALAMESHGKEQQVYLMAAPVLYAEHGTLRFFTHDVPRHNLLDPAELGLIEAEARAAGQDIYLIVLPHRLADLDGIMQAFPNGVRQEHYDHLNRLLYVSYQIPT